MQRTFCLLVVVLAAGCSSPKWHHSAKNQQDFYRDNSGCMAMSGSGQSTQIAYNPNSVMQGYNQGSAAWAQADREAIYEQCMQGNGWYLRR